ncbi:regulator of condensation [Ostertagia ostertagi]
MMANPYTCEVQLDELSPDHAIIDFAFISEENFVLVVLLASSGKDVPWGSSRWLPEHTSVLVPLPNAKNGPMSGDPNVYAMFFDKESTSSPTCCRKQDCCFIFKFKAGTILLVDLSSRKCVAELSAPQSIHEVEVLQSEENSDVLVRGFFYSRCWSIILKKIVKVEPPTSHLNLSTEGITVLDTGGSFVELHSDLSSLAGVPKKRFKVPPDTWMIHYTDNVLFAVSKQSEVRSAVHFGLSALRLEFSLVKGACEWRPLGFVPLSSRAARLPSCLIINERGLIRVAQSSTNPLENIAAEFLFRIPNFSLVSIEHVAKACSIDAPQLQRSVIPTLLSARRGKTLSPADLSRLLSMAKTAERSVIPTLLSARRGKTLSPADLSRLLSMAKTAEVEMENLVDLFANNQQEEQLLPEVVSKNMFSSVEAHNFSAFLSRHVDVDNGAKSCAEVQLWRSATLLALRHKASQAEVLRVLIRNGPKSWSSAVPSMRSLMMTCAANLDWGEMSDQDIGALVTLLCEWQAALNSIAHHETCLRLALTYMSTFPKHCSILYLISALYIISDKAAWTQEYDAVCRSISCGMNGSAAITAEGQLLIWGDFTNQQNKPFESIEVSGKTGRKSSTEAPTSPKRCRPQQLPHPVHVEGRPRVVCCGAEHILVLTSAGRLFSLGRNRFGQCGVGHSLPVSELQLVEGDWGSVRALSAGQFHSAILNTKGEVWTFGWGVWGQLGIGGRQIKDCLVPTKVPNLSEPIKEVSCGRVHTVLLTVSGKVLVAGSGSYGQLGTDEDIRKQYDFRPLPIDPSLKVL